METEITELLDAIKKEKELEDYFSKVILYLRRFCKKCEIVWEEKGKVKHLIKVGRSGIDKKEYNEFPDIRESGYDIIPIENEALGGKVFLKVKIKTKISRKKFLEIVDIISLGISTIVERRKRIHNTLFLEHRYKTALVTARKLVGYIKSICFSIQGTYDDAVEMVGKALEDAISPENYGIILSYKGLNIEKFKLKNDIRFRTYLEKMMEFASGKERLTESEIPVEEDKYFYYFPVKIEDETKGVIGIKTREKIEEDVYEIIHELAGAFAKFTEFYLVEKDRKQEEILQSLYDLSTAIAIFSKEKGSFKLTFENKKFKELTSLPGFSDIIKEDVEQSVKFRISSMREVEVSGRYFLISTKILENERDIMVEAVDITAEKQRIKDEIRRKGEEYLGEMAKILAQNILTPLQEILNSIELLESKIEVKKIKDKISEVRTTVVRIKDITEEFLKISKVKKEPDVYPKVDVLECINSVRKILDRELSRNEVKIEVVATEGRPQAMCDEFIMKQIFLNILENSIKSLTDKEKNGKKGGVIKIRTVEEDDAIKVEIEDIRVHSGPPLSPSTFVEKISGFPFIKEFLKNSGGDIEIQRKEEPVGKERGKSRKHVYKIVLKLPKESF